MQNPYSINSSDCKYLPIKLSYNKIYCVISWKFRFASLWFILVDWLFSFSDARWYEFDSGRVDSFRLLFSSWYQSPFGALESFNPSTFSIIHSWVINFTPFTKIVIIWCFKWGWVAQSVSVCYYLPNFGDLQLFTHTFGSFPIFPSGISSNRLKLFEVSEWFRFTLKFTLSIK